MTRLSLLEIHELVAIYLVANTPSYLYRHFRGSPTVQRLADSNSPAELVAFISRVDSEERTTPVAVALAHASAVAMTYQRSDIADSAIAGLVIQHLRWIPILFSIWKQGRIETTTTKVDLPRIEVPGRVSASTNVRIILPGGG